MTYKKIIGLLAFVLGLNALLLAQNPPISFHHLTVENGLNDGHIQMIGQDRFGYMWFGSLGALNRYDGRQVRTYAYRAGDSTSPFSGMAFCMVTDSSNNLFFGFENGLALFDSHKNHFSRVEALQDLTIFRIIAVAKDKLFLLTGQGLVKYDPLSNRAYFYSKTAPLLKGEMTEGTLKDQKLYIGTEKGICVFDLTTEKAKMLPLSITANLPINSVCFDDQNRLWVTTMSMPKVLRLSADFLTYEVYDKSLLAFDIVLPREYFIQRDKKNRIWISTKHIGLLQYVPETNSFVRHIHDEQKPWTPSSDVHLCIFCDKDGMIWLGSAEGINYFHPDKNLFETILPFDSELSLRNRRLARTVVEDKNKNLWFGTPDGVVRYDPKTKTYREWRNEPNKPPVLSYNSVRHLFCDEQNYVWIVTSKGLNRYNSQTDKMEILATDTTFASLNYMRIEKDRAGNYWFSTKDGDGYYTYNPKTKTLKGISQHPQLHRFTGIGGWCFFQDSKGRYWLGSDKKGLGMYDPNTQKTYHWRSKGANSIAGDVVFDIKEDKNGWIWIATNHGVTGIDIAHNTFKTYNSDNGLVSNSTSALAVDALNRLWIGTGKGLTMLDSSRQSFTNFGLQDGLPSLAFTNFPAYTTPDGDIIMPTQKGYVRFNPLHYMTEKQEVKFYISSVISVDGEHPIEGADDKAKIGFELAANENYFTLNLVALNYFNPSQTWFAYKLDGLETNWHITQDPKAVYTNLAGGNYTFRYKASLSATDWSMPEKTVAVHIATVFYKAYWFWALLIGIFGSLWYVYYQNKKKQKESLIELQSKAQLLEKEKAIMQYEGLKQQLNPHFLFNSLTSLSSLIEIDPSVASRFLDNMSKTYRYILKSSESETVLLRDEVRFAQNFVQLQNTRFETGLEVHFDIDEADLDKKIVPVTLQNMIENAIKHNIIDDESPLIITIYTEGGYLFVKNNLQKKNFVGTSNKRGLANLVSLYTYLSDKPVSTKETAMFFYVQIPLI
jgi:ligand-binding sensor domain-containing protein